MKLLTAILILAIIIPAGAKVKDGSGHGGKKSAAEIKVAVNTDDQNNKIDISEMVREQIAAARKKAEAEKSTPEIKVAVSHAAKQEKGSNGFWLSIREKIPLSDDTLIKVSVFAVFTILVFGFIISRRLFMRKSGPGKKKDIKGLKQNIALIREEKPVKIRKKNKLKTVRGRLLKKYSSVKMTNESISKTAKELKISKGELLLAERIKMHKMAGGFAGKK